MRWFLCSSTLIIFFKLFVLQLCYLIIFKYLQPGYLFKRKKLNKVCHRDVRPNTGFLSFLLSGNLKSNVFVKSCMYHKKNKCIEESLQKETFF